ncbi:hypothetical protein [Paracoccus rhizosphaerae]|uniref:Uncharacterized protein n=1 Tax=Paracoccus rhizosphaerae TaxID=1133347 RepID=A0ABV6CDR8_9RHOB|nr:hypothetical protein [Paracoccus rhizosphaerae]
MSSLARVIVTTETVGGFGCRYHVTRRKLVLFGRLTIWASTAWRRA